MDEDSTSYTFAKLSGSANYKKWSCEMIFALQEAELWGYITRECKKPRELTTKRDDDEDRLEKINQRNLGKLEFDEKKQRVVGKIGKIRPDDVQQEFLAMKDYTKNKAWTPKALWEYMKTRYTLKNWSAKWGTFNRFEKLDYSLCKSIEEYRSNACDIFAEITNMAPTLEEIVILKPPNGLGFSFFTYLTILNKQARKDKKFSKLDDLLKNLEDKEAQMRQDSIAVAHLVFKNKENQAIN